MAGRKTTTVLQTDVFDSLVRSGFEEFLERATVYCPALHHIAIGGVRSRS